MKHLTTYKLFEAIGINKNIQLNYNLRQSLHDICQDLEDDGYGVNFRRVNPNPEEDNESIITINIYKDSGEKDAAGEVILVDIGYEEISDEVDRMCEFMKGEGCEFDGAYFWSDPGQFANSHGGWVKYPTESNHEIDFWHIKFRKI